MYERAKRIIDFLLALLALIVLLPVFLLLVLLIRLDSEGPAIFRQQRVGKHNRIFDIYKFRTMRIGTPNLSTELLGNPDLYLTRIGRFLRKSSLDELPQLVNILQGHMAFIGPRPALFNQYKLIDLRKETGICSMRPGLTGYAQVMGRDTLSDEQKVEFEKYYSEHCSLLLDSRIIWWTIKNVMNAEGVRME